MERNSAKRFAAHGFCLKPAYSSICTQLSLRLLVIVCMTIILVLGATGQTFIINSMDVAGSSVNIDKELMLLGIVNKFLDLLVTSALEGIALETLTVWMTQPGSGASAAKGVCLSDFELADELTKPLKAITNFRTRLTTAGWEKTKWRGVTRLLLSVTTSVCVLLLGLAVNTIAMPKARWYPPLDRGWSANPSNAQMSTPQMVIQDVNWMNMWNEGWRIVGNGPTSWAAASAYSSAAVYLALSELWVIYTAPTPGWQPLNSNPPAMTGLNTAMRGKTMQSLSVQSSVIQSMFDDQIVNGPYFARGASGWTGNFTLTLPVLETTCIDRWEGSADEVTARIANSSEQDGSKSSMIISFPPASSLLFDGVSCTLQLRQALFPIRAWITSGAAVDLSVNDYGRAFDTNVTYLKQSTMDLASMTALSAQTQSILPLLSTMIPGLNVSEYFVMTARRLQDYSHDLVTDADAMTPVAAAMAQHLLSIAFWNLTVLSNETTVTSNRVQFQVYGSGPRLPWEWVVASIIAIILLSQIFGIYQMIRHHVRAGPWFSPAGMLITANMANNLKTVETAVVSNGKEEQNELAKTRFFIRDVDSDKMMLTNSDNEGKPLEKNKFYTLAVPGDMHTD